MTWITPNHVEKSFSRSFESSVTSTEMTNELKITLNWLNNHFNMDIKSKIRAWIYLSHTKKAFSRPLDSGIITSEMTYYGLKLTWTHKKIQHRRYVY